MTELDSNLQSTQDGPIQGHVMLTLHEVENRHLVMFSNGIVYGEVNAQLHDALTTLSQQAFQLDFEVFAPIGATRETISRSTKGKVAIVRVQLNIYGDLHSAKHVGQELSQHRVYLQRPDYFRPNARYDNPHVLKLGDFSSKTTEIPSGNSADESENSASADLTRLMTDVYSSLKRDQKLNRLRGDDRLVTQLLP